MSLRYAGKLVYQVAARSAQGIGRDYKCAGDAAAANTRAHGARRISATSPSLDAANRAAQKLKQSEESLRTAMFFSCWAPA